MSAIGVNGGIMLNGLDVLLSQWRQPQWGGGGVGTLYVRKGKKDDNMSLMPLTCV